MPRQVSLLVAELGLRRYGFRGFQCICMYEIPDGSARLTASKSFEASRHQHGLRVQEVYKDHSVGLQESVQFLSDGHPLSPK